MVAARTVGWLARVALAAALVTAAAGCHRAPSPIKSGLPAWMPLFPTGETVLLDSTSDEDTTSGAAFMSTTRPSDEVIGYYTEKLARLGMPPTVSEFDGPTGVGALLTAQQQGGRRGINVTVSPTPEGSSAVINFVDTK